MNKRLKHPWVRKGAAFAAATLITLSMGGSWAMAEGIEALTDEQPAESGIELVVDDAPAPVLEDVNDKGPGVEPVEDATAPTTDTKQVEPKGDGANTPSESMADRAEDAEEYIYYLDEHGNKQKVRASECIDITDKSVFKDKVGYGLQDGWYVAKDFRMFDNRLTITGDAKLILCDDALVDFQDGIRGYSGKLTIYGQSTGDKKGCLEATGSNNHAGIGGNDEESNNTEITICGGKVIARAYVNGAGIGGGDHGGCGNIKICGGYVSAHGGDASYFRQGGGAGIGSGDDAKSGGHIEITGGTVYGKGGEYAAGIGTGDEAKKTVNVCVRGGDVTGEGGVDGAGIGGGNETSGKVEIYGGTVTGRGNEAAAGIGGGDEGSCDVSIYGGTVTAKGLDESGVRWGSGIGSGDEGGKAKVKIYGGNVTAEGQDYGAGIGGGNESSCDVEISGGKITATGGEWGAGIGTGDECGSGGKITISGGDITAKSGDKGAGIGGGNETNGGTITISGGKVNAKGVDGDGAWDWMVGTSGGAGIGGGDEGDSGTIKITGGDVTAEAKGEKACAIGRGDDGKNKTIILGDNIKVVGNKGKTLTGGDRDNAIKKWHWAHTMPCE